jgi:hypothetical protein
MGELVEARRPFMIHYIDPLELSGKSILQLTGLKLLLSSVLGGCALQK